MQNQGVMGIWTSADGQGFGRDIREEREGHFKEEKQTAVLIWKAG